MRQVVLDTETTGLDVRKGHRLIEIAGIELINRRPTGEHYQTWLNPDRVMDEGARQITGIADAFLCDKPHFADVVDSFLRFIEGAELIIHNARFDLGFLDAELARVGSHHGCVTDYCRIIDTLVIARERYPGQRNSLDALCRRLGVNGEARDVHGGLIDARLLTEVYLAMTSGQLTLHLGIDTPDALAFQTTQIQTALCRPRVLRANSEESRAHERYLDGLDKSATAGGSVWRRS